MKLRSLLACFFIFSSTILFAQSTNTPDWTKFNFNGKVKSLHESFFNATTKKGKNIKKKKYGNKFEQESIINFNKEGNYTSIERFTPSGKPANTSTYVYSPQLRRIEHRSFDSNGGVSAENFSFMIYNEEGKVVEENTFSSDSVKLSRVAYEYDANGFIAEKNWYKKDSIFDMTMTWKYDAKGNIIEAVDYKKDGSVSNKFIYERDSMGNATVETWLIKGDKFVVKYLYTYDTHGNRSRIQWLKESGKISLDYSIEYVYDSTGNWTQATEVLHGKANSITERVFEYY